jgi:anti-sigma factor RsiW
MNGGEVVCTRIQAQFSSYLDGAVTGVAMQRIASHLRDCEACTEEFEGLRSTQAALASLAPLKAPDDLALRLRVAISKERARTPQNFLPTLKVRWQNTFAPFLLQASAGFASTVLLMGTVALLIGMFARPEPLAARDVPLGMASNPHFLYSQIEPEAVPIGGRDNPVIVEAYINGVGRVYDYHIVSGPNDANTRSALENLLLFSVFEPARVFGQPVRGLAVMSFTGISVRA